MEDKLFATLDPTTRRVNLPNNERVLLTDTVGFIQNLPHHLVAAFRATLEEVVEADLLLHVIDASHPYVEKQIAAVDKVLESLGAAAKPSIMVYNKVDLLPDGEMPIKVRGRQTVALSALKGRGFEQLLGALADVLSAGRIRKIFFIPYQKSGLLSILHEKGKVLREEHGEKGLSVETEIDLVWAGRVEQRLNET